MLRDEGLDPDRLQPIDLRDLDVEADADPGARPRPRGGRWTGVAPSLPTCLRTAFNGDERRVDPMRFLLVLVLAFGFIDNAGAVIIRHDVDPEAYVANAEDYPALFALYRTKKGYRDCIATLIAPQWAVTAAHCTEDKPFVNGLAAAGYDVEIGASKATIDKVVRYEPADGAAKRDLALLHFSAAIASVVPLPLYKASDEIGRVVLLPGWGDTGDGLKGISGADGRFRVAENRIDAARDGWLIWKFDDPRSGIGRSVALEGISGPGDSGGPALIMTPKGLAVAGVSSAQKTFGRPEGLYEAEEYYVRISEFVEWIEQTIGGP